MHNLSTYLCNDIIVLGRMESDIQLHNGFSLHVGKLPRIERGQV